MSTKSDRSPGTQFKKSGVSQGVSVIDNPEVRATDLLLIDYTGSPVNTTTYTELTPATSDISKRIEIHDSSGQSLVLAFGATGFEVDQIYIPVGGNGQILLSIPMGTRLSVKAVSNDATSGELLVNLYDN